MDLLKSLLIIITLGISSQLSSQDPCIINCCDQGPEFTVEGLPLGSLPNAPSGWYDEYGASSVVAQGCNNSSKSVEVYGPSFTGPGSAAGIRRNGAIMEPLLIFDNQYCISLCYRFIGGTDLPQGDLDIRAANTQQTGPNCTGDCELVVTSPFVSTADGWQTLQVLFTPSNNYDNLIFSHDNVGVLDGTGQFLIDDVCITQLNNPVLDVDPPIIACPVDITFQADPNFMCETEYIFPVILAVDNSGAIPTMSCTLNGNPIVAGDLVNLGVGTHQVVCIATDDCGNSSDCSFNVVVECECSFDFVTSVDSINMICDDTECASIPLCLAWVQNLIVDLDNQCNNGFSYNVSIGTWQGDNVVLVEGSGPPDFDGHYIYDCEGTLIQQCLFDGGGGTSCNPNLNIDINTNIIGISQIWTCNDPLPVINPSCLTGQTLLEYQFNFTNTSNQTITDICFNNLSTTSLSISPATVNTSIAPNGTYSTNVQIIGILNPGDVIIIEVQGKNGNWFCTDLVELVVPECPPCFEISEVSVKDIQCDEGSCEDDPLCQAWLIQLIQQFNNQCQNGFTYQVSSAIWQGSMVILIEGAGPPDFDAHYVYSCEGTLIQECLADGGGGTSCAPNANIDINNDLLSKTSLWICNDPIPIFDPLCLAGQTNIEYCVHYTNISNHVISYVDILPIAPSGVYFTPFPQNVNIGVNQSGTICFNAIGNFNQGDILKANLQLSEIVGPIVKFTCLDTLCLEVPECPNLSCFNVNNIETKDVICNNDFCPEDPFCLTWLRDLMTDTEANCLSGFNYIIEQATWNGQTVFIWNGSGPPDFDVYKIYTCDGTLIQDCMYDGGGGFPCTVDSGINPLLDLIGKFPIWQCGDVLPPIDLSCLVGATSVDYCVSVINTSGSTANQVCLNTISPSGILAVPSVQNISIGANSTVNINFTLIGNMQSGDLAKIELSLKDPGTGIPQICSDTLCLEIPECPSMECFFVEQTEIKEVICDTNECFESPFCLAWLRLLLDDYSSACNNGFSYNVSTALWNGQSFILIEGAGPPDFEGHYIFSCDGTPIQQCLANGGGGIDCPIDANIDINTDLTNKIQIWTCGDNIPPLDPNCLVGQTSVEYCTTIINTSGQHMDNACLQVVNPNGIIVTPSQININLAPNQSTNISYTTIGFVNPGDLIKIELELKSGTDPIAYSCKDTLCVEIPECPNTDCFTVNNIEAKEVICSTDDCPTDPFCLAWLIDLMNDTELICGGGFIYHISTAIWNGQTVYLWEGSGPPDFDAHKIYTCDGTLIQDCGFDGGGGLFCTIDSGIDINSDLTSITPLWTCGDLVPSPDPNCLFAPTSVEYCVTITNTSSSPVTQACLNSINPAGVLVLPATQNISLAPNQSGNLVFTVLGNLNQGDIVKIDVGLKGAPGTPAFCQDSLCVEIPECPSDCCLDEQAFCDLVNFGWNVSIVGCQVTVSANQFGDCHWFATDGPDWGDASITIPQVIPANGTWTHTYNLPGTYNICINVFEGDDPSMACWSKDMCVPISVDCCPNIDPCSLVSIETAVDSSDECCFTGSITNEYCDQYFKGIEIEVTNGAATISQVMGLNGWTIQQITTTRAKVIPPTQYVPMGILDIFRVCPENVTGPVNITISWLTPNDDGSCDLVCSEDFTMELNCSSRCIDIVSDSLDCDNQVYCFKIKNNTNPSFNIGSIVLDNIMPSGASITPNPITISPVLEAGLTSDWICVSYTNVAAGDDLCFNLVAHLEDINSDPNPTWCCTDTINHCVEIPISCDPCDFVDIMTTSNASGDTCCWTIDVLNNFDPSTFIGIRAEVLTAGAYFANISANTPDWGLQYIASNEYIFNYNSNGGYIPLGTRLTGDFCLTGYTSSAQQVQFSFLEIDPVTLDTIETCFFIEDSDCPAPPTNLPCTDISEVEISCVDNLGTYTISFNITNNTHLPPVGPPGYDFLSYSLSNWSSTNTGTTISPVHANISPALTSGSTTTSPVTHTISNGNPGDQICFTVTGHDQLTGGAFNNCCTADTVWCFVLPDNLECDDPINGCCLDQDGFYDLVDLGFEIDIDSCSVTVSTDQFDSCHYFTWVEPDWGDGPTPLSGMIPANASWTHTYNTSGTYIICIEVAEFNSDGSICWSDIMCEEVEVNCLPECCADQDDFDDLVDLGLNIQSDACTVTISADQFNECHYFTWLDPDWGDGNNPSTGMIPTSTSWTHTYASSGTYTICIEVSEFNSNGDICWTGLVCGDVEIDVDVDCSSPPCTLDDITVPNGLTPNGDGFNDLLIINRPVDCRVDISIYNRWGQLVWQQGSYDDTWGGQSMNGEQLPDGTYFLIMALPDSRSEGRAFETFLDIRTK